MAVSFPIASSDSGYCRRQADECARRAKLAISSEVKSDFQQLEQMWLESAEVGDEPLHLPTAGLRSGGL
jgi:hypothetical protein